MARHGENIRQRKDGRWEGRYIKGRRSDGKAVWGSVYAHTYAEVKDALMLRKAECSYYALSCENPTFAELSWLWLGSIFYGVKASTAAHYRYTLQRYLLPVFGSVKVKALNEGKLEQGLLQVFAPTDGSHKPLGASQARECLVLVRRICKYAAHLRLIRPIEIEVKLPQSVKKQPAPLSVVEQVAVERFVQREPTARKVGLLLAMRLGLRIGEVCGLQWGDFDLDVGVLYIRRTVQRISCGNGHTAVSIQTPKTRTSARELPIPRGLLPLLHQLRGAAGDSVWFLSGNAEKPVEPRCYRKSIHAYLRQAAVRSVHPHMLRHTFATTCLQAGCDIKTLSDMLGHANPTITLQRYVHTDMDQKRSVLERIYMGKKPWEVCA